MTALLVALAVALLLAVAVRLARANQKVTVLIEGGPIPCEFCGGSNALAIRRWRAGVPRTGFVYACPRHFDDAIERLRP